MNKTDNENRVKNSEEFLREAMSVMKANGQDEFCKPVDKFKFSYKYFREQGVDYDPIEMNDKFDLLVIYKDESVPRHQLTESDRAAIPWRTNY